MLKEVNIPDELTYVGVFLTLFCDFNCSYCINYFGKLKMRKELTPEQWIEGLNRLQIDRSWMVPLTLQGGEPSKYERFIKVIRDLRPDFYIDMLTNLDFDIRQFMDEISPSRMQRSVPYASIRVSYHPEYSDQNELLGKIFKLQSSGYSIGLFGVEHPDSDLSGVAFLCKQLGIDFRTKEFLGRYNGQIYGTYKYLEAINSIKKNVKCRTSEILIAPDGKIHRCHRDLYYNENPLGNILDKDLKVVFKFRECYNFGAIDDDGEYNSCSLCDIKVKNNRFQEYGTCAVEIRNDI